MATDDEQFRAWVQDRRGDLLRTAIFLAAGDPWAAEDLVQTTLMRLYVAWPRVRADTVEAYARRCLLNALIDHRRLSATHRELSRVELPETAVSDPSPIDTRSVVFDALAQLPVRMRAAVVMRHLLDLSVEETAEALRCSEGTVKSQTARGLDQLRTALQAKGIALDPRSGPATDGPASDAQRAAPPSAVTHLSSNS
jgi:RNA polymerase sigma-70 factor (sigma-E family)